VYKPLLKTRFVGKFIQYVTSCHSTNDIAAHKVRTDTARDGEIIIAGEQTAGRGQRGRSWVTEKDRNFTFSIIFRPPNLPVKHQFQLSQAIALGVRKYVASKVFQPVKIKWPNDIFIGHLKTAGLLIENSVRGSRIHAVVAGIGLNMNQREFESPRATSVGKETGRELVLKEELEDLLLCIEEYYIALMEEQYAGIRAEYLRVLYGHGERRKFRTEEDEIYATVTNVSPEGRLIVEVDGRELTFGIQELSWVWE